MGEIFPQPFGRYELLERLAVGGMAELFVAKVVGEHGFEKQVVIKRLLPHMAAAPRYNAMFIDEAKLTARLVHPRIAQTYELGSYNDLLYISMEYVEGFDALAMLRELAHRRERLAPELAVYIAHEVLDALDFAHNQTDTDGEPLGVVHRDVSPSNVLLSLRGDIKLVDFGIARASDRQHRTKSGTLKGKYGYMSPEQVVGDPIDHRSDVFSVGVVLAEMLTGRRLFAAPNELDVLLMVRDAKLDRLERFGGHLDASVLSLVRKGLSKSLTDRFQSAREFRDALDQWLFDHRHRVGAARIRSIVDSLHEDAVARKRATMADSGQVRVLMGAAAVAAPAQQIDGIPSGNLRVTDSMPVLSYDSPDFAPSAVPEPIEVVDSGSIPIEIGEAISGATDLPDISELALGPTGESPAQLSVPEAVDAVAEHSVRYPSIQEALTSLSPQSLDPSAVEFDDVPLPDASVVRSKSGQFRVPSQTELDVAGSSPHPVLAEIDDEGDDSGEFRSVPAITVMYRLTRAKGTGLLVVAAGAVRKEIYLRDGTPEFVSSNVAKELFGGYLVQKKKISEGELAMALAMMPHYGGKLGDTLVGLGLMRPLDVFRMLTNQVRDKLVDVCTWSKGEFVWYAGRENPREAFPLDLDSYEVLGAGAMALRAEFIEPWIEAHADACPRSAKVSDLTPEHFQIGDIGRKVYDKLTGRKTVRQLSTRYTDNERRLEFMRALILLVCTDLAVVS